MKKSDSIAELSKALAKFQENVKQPKKDKNNPFFKSKYVPLENVIEAISDTAPSVGLSFTQWALNDDTGRVGVATLLLHESGEYIEFDPVFMNADKNTAQGAGSLITYLKRYTLSAVFGITSDEDDDGNGTNKSAGNQNQQQKQPNQPKPASKDQMELLHNKANELAELYGMDANELKAKLKIGQGHSEIEFKQLLKRVTDGITKVAAEKAN